MTNKLRRRAYGSRSFVKSAWVPEILEIGRRMLKRLEYRGIFEIEFKRDARDGTFKIIEFNPRCWSQIMLATRANVNVAHRAYLDLGNGPGKRVAFKASRKNKFWINFERDLGHVKRKIASGDFSLLGVLKVLVTLPCVEPFDRRDLRPSLFYVRKKFAQRIGLGNANH
jgi:D-aspartate ligase